MGAVPHEAEEGRKQCFIEDGLAGAVFGEDAKALGGYVFLKVSYFGGIECLFDKCDVVRGGLIPPGTYYFFDVSFRNLQRDDAFAVVEVCFHFDKHPGISTVLSDLTMPEVGKMFALKEYRQWGI